jgi:hypothetical protein
MPRVKRCCVELDEGGISMTNAGKLEVGLIPHLATYPLFRAKRCVLTSKAGSTTAL